MYMRICCRMYGSGYFRIYLRGRNKGDSPRGADRKQ